MSGQIHVPASPAALKRNVNLDLIRILACIAVIGLHTVGKDITPFNTVLYFLSGFAVPAFFMASGYMLLRKDAVTPGYVLGKIGAVFRVVILWNVLLWVAKLVAGLVLRGRFDWNLQELFRVTINGFFQKDWFWQFWYLGALVVVYVCLPFVLWVAKKGWLKNAWLALAIVGTAIQAASMFVGSPVQKEIVQTFRLWTWLQYFMLGGLLSRSEFFNKLLRWLPSLRLHGIALAGWTVITVIYQYLCGKYVIHNTHAEFFYDSVMTMIWSVLLFTFVLRMPLHERVNGVVAMAAPLTMAVYIIHPLVITAAGMFIGINTGIACVVYFIAVTAVSFAAAFILSKIPFGKYFMRL